MSHAFLPSFLSDFARFPEENHQQRTTALDRAQLYSFTSLADLTACLQGLAQLEPSQLERAKELCDVWLRHIRNAFQKFSRTDVVAWRAAEVTELLAALLDRWPEQSSLRSRVLECLAWSQTSEEWQLFCQQLLKAPPAEDRALTQVLAPLFQRRDYDPALLFPNLLAGLAQPRLAAPILDLANYFTRSGRLPQHPLAERTAALIALLGDVAARLSMIEEHPQRQAVDPRQLADVVAHGVALAVSLCDALALLKATEAIPKLHQTAELKHRRLRTEAAGALARLGDEHGKKLLLELAAEPVARLRVLAYAEELGLIDELDAQWRTPHAKAAAALVLWLAEPAQYGVPPVECTLADERTLYWPGYEEPMQCFLFRFSYRFQSAQGTAEFANYGIAGPLVHALATDLLDWPLEDVYAIFAGWQAEHEDIFEVEAHLFSEGQRIDAARLERRLRDEGCDNVQPLLLSSFFSEKALVAQVTHRGAPATALASANDFLCYPRSERSPGPDQLLWLYRGRKMLAQFNAEPELT